MAAVRRPSASAATIDAVLSTKLRVPQVAGELVARPRLTAALDAGARTGLTLVCAPAGFGKTTVLSQWTLRSRDRVAWLSLDAGDDVPVRFLLHLIASLRVVQPDLGECWEAPLGAAQQPPVESVLTLLINTLAQRTEPFSLVLDDYHLLRGELVHRAVGFLLEHLPPPMHLVISSRSDPPLPLARLRARGHLTELRADDLRFTPGETASFLADVMGFALGAADLEALEARTEGWIAGLQLAAMSMRGHPDATAFLAAFTGSHRFILDYLVEEVLVGQPPAVQRFLLETSVLERLTAPLCEAVTGRRGAQARLEALERANLFLLPLDEERRWYRYHQLFAEVLRNRLVRVRPDAGPLHRRASAWLERNGLVVEAASHALAAADHESVARLIEERGLALMMGGRLDRVLIWLDALPEGVVQGRASLCLIRAVGLVLTPRWREADGCLRHAQRAVAHLEASDGDASAVLALVTALRSRTLFMAGDLAGGVALVRQALERMPERATSTALNAMLAMLRPAAQVYAAGAYRASGDVGAENERAAAEAAVEVRATGNLLTSLRALTALARLRMLQGRLHAAVATYAEAARLLPVHESLHLLGNSPSYFFGVAEIHLEWNDLSGADRHLTQGFDITRSMAGMSVEADVILHGFLTLAGFERARGDVPAAFAALDAFARLAHQHGFAPWLTARAAAARVPLWLARGDLAAAERWAVSSGLRADATAAYLHEDGHRALARVLLAANRVSEAKRLLARLLVAAEDDGRLDSAIRILAQLALAHRAGHDTPAALTALGRALAAAEPEGYARVFLDEGAPMAALLSEAARHGVQGDYARTLLAAAGPSAPPPLPGAGRGRSSADPRDLLSERELTVLRLISGGLADKEIARELSLSPNTVKWYAHSIYGKLGVGKRAKAAALARELHLI